MMVRHESRSTNLASQAGVKHGPILQHGASDLQQPVRHTAKRTCVAVTASTQRGVLALADGVMLNSDAGPMVDRVLKSVVRRLAAHHNDGLSGASGNRRYTTETSQSLIVPSSYGVMRFCELTAAGSKSTPRTIQGGV